MLNGKTIEEKATFALSHKLMISSFYILGNATYVLEDHRANWQMHMTECGMEHNYRVELLYLEQRQIKISKAGKFTG